MTSPFDRDALLALDDIDFVKRCRVDAFRGSGPGGQKRNKTSSGIRVTHDPSGCAAVATVKRSQQANLGDALRSLRLEIALAVRRDVDGDMTLPSATHGMQMYFVEIARAFDVLETTGWSIAEAAAAIGGTTGQLARWRTADPLVLAAANRQRRARGQRILQPRA